jgi:DNA processing protein
MDNKEKAAACALNHIFGYEPKIALRIVQELGSASAVFDLSPKERNALTGPYSKYAGSLSDELLENSSRELEELEEKGCGFLPYSHPAYPKLLKECEDPPAGIYYKSSSPPDEVFNDAPFISIVGTRDMSSYGKEWCIKIVEALSYAPQKPVIVSGLAFGVDITAHSAALHYGLPTIAVLPNGINSVYPSAHRPAARKIASSPGCALITDYPPGTGPMAFTFLRRNRIIAGLSRATLLIESKIRGGGLITARLASDYGRDVFALPGRIDDIRSQGCNLLLVEKIAEPIVNLADACRQMGLGNYNLRKRSDLLEWVGKIYKKIPEDKRSLFLQLVQEIKKQRGITLGELCTKLGKPYSVLVGMAATLESDGIIDIDLLGRCTINAKNA